MIRSLGWLLVPLAVVQVACVPTKGGGIATAVGGAAMTVAGGAMMADLNGPGDDTDGDGVDEFKDKDLECALGGCAIAGLMLLGGLVLLATGVVVATTAEEEPPAPAIPLAAPPPPEVSQVDTRIVASLPEVPCDAETLRLAKQARSAAREGQCDVAVLITAKIAQRDEAYAGALLEAPALQRCR